MKQLKVSLPDELREELDAATEGSGRSLAEEIRNRLERTFADEAKSDAQTRELASNILELAALIRRHSKVDWHQHTEVFAALKMAIDTYLDGRAQAIENSPIGSGFRNMQEAEAVGRVVAGNFLHDWALSKRQSKRGGKS